MGPKIFFLAQMLVYVCGMAEEKREKELAINFGNENFASNIWYLWEVNKLGSTISRQFKDFQREGLVSVNLHSNCSKPCKFSLENGGILTSREDPVFQNGLRSNLELSINFVDLSPGIYELSLYLRNDLSMELAHNLLAIFRKSYGAYFLADRVLTKSRDDIIDGHVLPMPFDPQDGGNDGVWFRVQSLGRPFVLSALKLTKFSERRQINDRIKLVNRNQATQGFFYSAGRTERHAICGAYYGRSVLLGYWRPNTEFCVVQIEGGMRLFRHFGILKWQSSYNWLPWEGTVRSSIKMVNSYSREIISYCLVELLEGYRLGHIQPGGTCRFDWKGTLQESENFQYLAEPFPKIALGRQ